MSEDEDYSTMTAAAGRMGKAARYLAAAVCILATGGELDASPAHMDDEGADLVFHRRGGSVALGVRVKARMSTARGVQDERFRAWVRSQTFEPRADLDVLFAAVDVEHGAIMTAWLVPSAAFRSMASGPDARGRLRITTSLKPYAEDQWSPYRLTAAELPRRILARLAELEKLRTAG